MIHCIGDKHAIQQVVKSAKGGVKELAADGTEGDN